MLCPQQATRSLPFQRVGMNPCPYHPHKHVLCCKGRIYVYVAVSFVECISNIPDDIGPGSFWTYVCASRQFHLSGRNDQNECVTAHSGGHNARSFLFSFSGADRYCGGSL